MKDGSTPLHLAVEHTHEDMVQILLEAGADPDCKNKEGDTPYSLCEDDELKKEMARWRQRLPTSSRYRSRSRSPEHRSRSRSRSRSPVRRGRSRSPTRRSRSPSNTPSPSPEPPKANSIEEYVKEAKEFIESDDSESLHALLKKNAKLAKHKMDDGKTLLHYAARRGAKSCILTLLKTGTWCHYIKLTRTVGANIDARDRNDDSPLHVAIQNRQQSVAVTLINNDANTEVRDKNDNVPIHLAAKHGCLKVIQSLYEKDSSCLDESNRRRQTPLHLAGMLYHKYN